MKLMQLSEISVFVVTVKHWKLHLSTLPVLVIYIVNVIVNPGHRYLLVPVNTCVSGLVL